MKDKNKTKLTGLLTLFVAISGVGCSSKPLVPKNPAAEEAAIKMESAKREYNECYDAPGRPSCDALKRLYEKDRKAYEDSLK